MRKGRLWAVLGAAFWLAASCAEPAQAAPREDVLVLEVGGPQESLRGALRARGVDVAAPQRLRPVAVDPSAGGVEPDPEPAPVPVRDPSPGPDPTPDPGPEPTPPPLSEWVTVELQKDETLIHVARRYLGNGTRWAEIVAWNGFTEAQLKRLQIGQPIKLKRSECK